MEKLNKGSVLVTGGAGYIGSHTVLALQEAGWLPIVMDDLSTGYRELVLDEVPFIKGDIAAIDLVRRVLRDHRIIAVLHFAGSIIVPESVREPLKYYRNNTCASRSLIEACLAERVERFVFSSTAAVYGEPSRMPIDEAAPLAPVNPYGNSKRMTEAMLEDVAAVSGFRYVSLRYFNVAGADPQGRSGQISKQATHLIKVACEAAADRRDGVEIYGTDYDTPDGTCIRDYIHVTDLAQAHVMALDDLIERGENLIFNCGYGHGYSVRDVLLAVQKSVGQPIRLTETGRRPGDAAVLVADSRRLRRRLGWEPKYDDLEKIIETALAWELNLALR